MKKQFTVKGWQVEFDWRGMTLTPPEQIAKPGDRYREIKPASWMQAADAFVPGGLLLAEAPVQRLKQEKTERRRPRRRRIS